MPTKPVAFVFGPEHGPVTEQLVFAAAKEANLKSYAHLYVVGFAIQPGASRLVQSCEEMVGLPATYVQATMDLLMGDLLKTTRASQIFSVTGAPDVKLVRLKRKNGNRPPLPGRAARARRVRSGHDAERPPEGRRRARLAPRQRLRRRGTRSNVWTSKPVRETQKSHLNFVVADTEKWEQTAAFYLETDPHVLAYAKNFNLGFAIPYTHSAETREYLPDFLVRVQKEGQEVGALILETKGYDPLKHVKVGAAQRWVEAVNAEGSWGRWAYRIVSDPTITPAALASAAYELANPPHTDWRAALRDFSVRVREVYGRRLSRVMLYGSRARGDAEWDSDVDVVVVLDAYDNFWAEVDRLSTLTGETLRDHGVVLSAMPATVKELEESSKPIFENIRREGVVIP